MGKMTLEEKKKSAAAAMAKFNKKLKDDSVVVGFGSDPAIQKKLTIERIPTPSIRVNNLIGDGIPRGKAIMFMGDPDSGKTGMAAETCGLLHKTDPNSTVLWLETENSLELEALENMYGIDLDRLTYINLSKEVAAEGALDALISQIENSEYDIAVINSIKCLTPSKEYDDNMGDNNIGLQARMLGKLMRKIIAIIDEKNTALIMVNHKMTDIGIMFGNNLVPAGGRAIRYYSLIILDFVSKKIQDADPVSKETHKKIGVTSVKNHCSQMQNPYGRTEYYIEYGVGIDVNVEIIDVLLESGVLSKAGAWFSIINDETGEPLEINGVTCKWQGKEKLTTTISENKELKEALLKMAKGEKIEFEKLSEEEIEKLQEEELSDSMSLNKSEPKSKKTKKKDKE